LYEVSILTGDDTVRFPEAPCVTVTTAECREDWVGPASGETDYYLYRPLTPFPGSWGEDSTGIERVIVCP
jgi:hypothetical protein